MIDPKLLATLGDCIMASADGSMARFECNYCSEGDFTFQDWTGYSVGMGKTLVAALAHFEKHHPEDVASMLGKVTDEVTDLEEAKAIESIKKVMSGG